MREVVSEGAGAHDGNLDEDAGVVADAAVGPPGQEAVLVAAELLVRRRRVVTVHRHDPTEQRRAQTQLQHETCTETRGQGGESTYYRGD